MIFNVAYTLQLCLWTTYAYGKQMKNTKVNLICPLIGCVPLHLRVITQQLPLMGELHILQVCFIGEKML